MGLMQRAMETYETWADQRIGIYEEGSEVLAPIGHIVTSVGIIITLKKDGTFVSAQSEDKSSPKKIIPATEKSSGRSGTKPYPHPLCDKLEYLSGSNAEKYKVYVKQLSDWASSPYSHSIVKAVLSYVETKTILSDLNMAGLLKKNQNGTPKEDAYVCWSILDNGMHNSWEERSLFESWINYYQSLFSKEKTSLSMLTGSMERNAEQHPKGAVAHYGNAKIISSNDKTGFTWRGRFTEEEQALTVGYEDTQKAHAALKWLAANQGVSEEYGGRTFVCWCPQGKMLIRPSSPLRRVAGPIVIESDYRKDLQEVVDGICGQLNLDDRAVIVSLDAATNGRLAITHYEEYRAMEFLRHVQKWCEECCWWKDDGIQSPSLKQIVNYAFGTPRKGKSKDQIIFETDSGVMRQQMERIIVCRAGNRIIPGDFAKGLMHHCVNVMQYDERTKNDLLFTACAVIRATRMRLKKEEWKLSLEPEKSDVSYQYGRLLAIMEAVERWTYERDERREPNAIRLMSVFINRPLHTSAMIIEQLKRAYFPQLKPWQRQHFDLLIGDVMAKISEFGEDELRLPLKDTYLLGYYLQKKEIYTKKADRAKEEE